MRPWEAAAAVADDLVALLFPAVQPLVCWQQTNRSVPPTRPAPPKRFLSFSLLVAASSARRNSRPNAPPGCVTTPNALYPRTPAHLPSIPRLAQQAARLSPCRSAMQPVPVCLPHLAHVPTAPACLPCPLEDVFQPCSDDFGNGPLAAATSPPCCCKPRLQPNCALPCRTTAEPMKCDVQQPGGFRLAAGSAQGRPASAQGGCCGAPDGSGSARSRR